MGLRALNAVLLANLALIAALIGIPCCVAHAASESLNWRTGAIDVDYASYLAKHDVVFNHPITNPSEGITVGNGRVGAMVWNQNGLTMQVSGVDTSEESAFSAGLVHLYTTPAMDSSGTHFQQRLSLYDGLLVTRYDRNRVVTVMGSPNSEVLGIHVEEAEPGVTKITLDLSIWDVSHLSGGDVSDLTTWRTVETNVDATGVALSRGQHDAAGFGYTIRATVEGTRYTAQAVGSSTVRLNIVPAASYTIWIACASRLNAPQHDSRKQAERVLSAVKARGYEATLGTYTDWWHAFWQKSFVQYSGLAADGDYLENLYYLYEYVIASGSYGNYPFHFINGDFSAVGDAKSAKWSVAYWYWNERDVYASFLASNHSDIVHGLNQLYSRNFTALADHTRQKYGLSGIWVPETMGWDGNARFTDGSDWTKNILSTGAEVAASMYAEYRYTDDASYLRDTAYPFARAVASFYLERLKRNPKSGRYEIEDANAHETYWNVRDPITDLAAIQSLFPLAIRMSQTLNTDADMRARWTETLAHLAPYPLTEDGSRYAPHDPPASPAHNAENITSELIWPYSVTGLGAADYSMALNGWRTRPFPYSNIWADDAIQAARLGLGDEVLKGLRFLNDKYQSYPNGLTNDPNGNFEYMGTHLSAINESLLQSQDDKLRVFPAAPTSPGFIGRFTLAARGGFLVSAEYAFGSVQYVAIKSLYGHPVTLVNPWGHEWITVRETRGSKLILQTQDSELLFSTAAGAVYVVERALRPLGDYSHLRLTGITNRDAKRLSGSKATLGAFLKAQPMNRVDLQ